ncbi:hypothetical protein [Xylanimonas sp. McL0601]|uniref:hypothetical protein n=1 Tax=Xylanimonas sp. McL0601 TaxID=3414739 RepID=UPI003CF67215
MRTITRRFLSRHTAEALALADQEGAVAVNDRWTLVAGTAAADPLAALVARGLVEPPKDPIPWGDESADSSDRQYTAAEVDELVAWGKGDH